MDPNFGTIFGPAMCKSLRGRASFWTRISGPFLDRDFTKNARGSEIILARGKKRAHEGAPSRAQKGPQNEPHKEAWMQACKMATVMATSARNSGPLEVTSNQATDMDHLALCKSLLWPSVGLLDPFLIGFVMFPLRHDVVSDDGYWICQDRDIASNCGGPPKRHHFGARNLGPKMSP